ncbi:DUF4393 domain-containing protein [Paraconexibacter antarcticus]|uniref:DUF4393 domain-containing protein n=1 Tax=Paraconexibacter antarcticus TaxID=2949664 RepID=A0ABY5DYR6_9ACTN|nr:DUF4393 domain-containing protein [Paraconexibacter antarcticus]UTI66685.1 DUF4393 domain-containing protein [Paraconexibacter antarcticus]
MAVPFSSVFGALGAVAGQTRAVAREIPGVRTLEAQVAEAERALVRELKRRLDGVDDRPLAALGEAPEPASPGPPPSPAETMGALLRQSMRNTPADSRRALHGTLLAEIVPDEARILSALSDGSAYPLVHVAEPGVGPFQKRVLENASSVGRAAGVALPDRTHIYVAHLRRLGLVETGPEDTSIRDEYELLLSDAAVRAAIGGISRGPLGPRIIRQTVRLSPLGRELWDATT